MPAGPGRRDQGLCAPREGGSSRRRCGRRGAVREEPTRDGVCSFPRLRVASARTGAQRRAEGWKRTMTLKSTLAGTQIVFAAFVALAFAAIGCGGGDECE